MCCHVNLKWKTAFQRHFRPCQLSFRGSNMKCDTVAAWQTRWIPKSQRTVWRAPWQPADWSRFFCPVSPVLDNPDSKHFQHQNTSSNWCRGHRMSHTTPWLTASNARFLRQTLLWFRVSGLGQLTFGCQKSLISFIYCSPSSCNSLCVMEVLFILLSWLFIKLYVSERAPPAGV